MLMLKFIIEEVCMKAVFNFTQAKEP